MCKLTSSIVLFHRKGSNDQTSFFANIWSVLLLLSISYKGGTFQMSSVHPFELLPFGNKMSLVSKINKERILFFKGLDKGEAPPPPPPAPTPRTPSDEEKAEAVNLDVQGLNISEVSIYVSNASQFPPLKIQGCLTERSRLIKCIFCSIFAWHMRSVKLSTLEFRSNFTEGWNGWLVDMLEVRKQLNA